MKLTKKIFKMPKAVTVMGRSSSITNSFVNGIVPVVEPNDDEIYTAIKILEENPEDMRCIYCGNPMTEWDHLFPLVEDRRSTGYISEIRNLVPACGKCNQSKGNSDWKEWMIGDAPQSPKTRNIPDLDHRIGLIEKYIEWGNPKFYDFSKIIDNDLWEKHWGNCENIIAAMKESEDTMKEIKKILEEEIVGSDK
ncbi:CRISPR-associated endonuclease Cas9 [termite gut metagenome]|uniref:CRISPR-associated endonuclease Cas9 n=1 Tax=termite gut metagenome TaxID=433724 RepID=A0A5J4RAH7_9ZZZZ